MRVSVIRLLLQSNPSYVFSRPETVTAFVRFFSSVVEREVDLVAELVEETMPGRTFIEGCKRNHSVVGVQHCMDLFEGGILVRECL